SLAFGEGGAFFAIARYNRYTDAKRVIAHFGYDQVWRMTRHPRLSGDIDGDDRADIVGFGQSGVIIATSSGNSFDKPLRAVYDFGYDQGWRVDLHVRVLAHVNGDGLADIVGFGDYATLVALAEK